MSREEKVAAVRRTVRELYRALGYGNFYAPIRMALCPFFRVEEYIPTSGRIIDIGCGYGLMANILARMAPAREVYGVDKSAYRIAQARASLTPGTRIEFVEEDIRASRLTGCRGLTMIDFLHHIPFALQEEILRKIPALLGDDGVLVIKEYGDRPRWKYWATWVFEAVFYPADKLTYRPVPEWVRLLTGLGFAVTTHTAGEGSFVPSVIIVARKTGGR